MIDRIILFVASDEIEIHSGKSGFNVIVDSVTESDNYLVLEEDETQELVWAVPSSEKSAYGSVSDYFEHIIPYMQYVIFFNISVSESCVNCEVFSGEQFELNHMQLIGEASGACGSECVEQVELLLDISVAEFWDWEMVTTVYPVTMEI